jgi:hypothetical protein
MAGQKKFIEKKFQAWDFFFGARVTWRSPRPEIPAD